MALELNNKNVSSQEVSINLQTSSATKQATAENSSASIQLPFNIDEILKKTGLTLEQYKNMTPAQQQNVIQQYNQNTKNENLTGLIIEPGSKEEQIADSHVQNSIQRLLTSKGIQPPTAKEWKAMSAEQRRVFILGVYQENMKNIPEEKRDETLKKFINEKVREHYNYSEEEWNALNPKKRERMINNSLLSFETAVLKGLSHEDFEKMSEFDKLIANNDVIEEKIKQGIATADDIKLNNYAHQAQKNYDTLNKLQSVLGKQEGPTLRQDFESVYDSVLKNIDLDSTKGKKKYNELYVDYLNKRLENATPEEVEKIIASTTVGLDEASMKKEALIFSQNANKLKPENQKKLADAFNAITERCLDKANNGKLISQEDAQTFANAASTYGKIVKDDTNDNVNKTMENMAKLDKQVNKNGDPEAKIISQAVQGVVDEIEATGDQDKITSTINNMTNGASLETAIHANSKTGGLDEPHTKQVADNLVKNQDLTQKEKEILADTQYNSATQDQIFVLQKPYNESGQKGLMKATGDATQLVEDPDKQREFDQNNFNAYEELEDEELAQELHKQRIDNIPKCHVENQLAMHDLTMKSKYQEIIEYAASNIFKLDESVQNEALKSVLETGNEKAIQAASEQLPKCAQSVKAETEKYVVKTVAGNYAQAVAKVEVQKGDIPQESYQEKVREYAEKFIQSSPKEQFDMISKLGENQQKTALTLLARFAPSMLQGLVTQGFGQKILSIPGISNDVIYKVIDAMIKSGSSKKTEAYKYIQKHPSLFRKETVDEAKQALYADDITTKNKQIQNTKTTERPSFFKSVLGMTFPPEFMRKKLEGEMNLPEIYFKA